MGFRVHTRFISNSFDHADEFRSLGLVLIMLLYIIRYPPFFFFLPLSPERLIGYCPHATVQAGGGVDTVSTIHPSSSVNLKMVAAG